MTEILGLPWEFLKANAMLDLQEEASEEDYLKTKKVWEIFKKALSAE